ncbi:glycoside hydrolase family 13 protein [Lyngbya confervoides]|uniref:Alpha-glucosidase n=1 Tax=Lyngbya confervoides BDU141951 TaxID=1574623 RepID=A0ABD4SYZ9_9CYAN|nr:alpha-glucosidase [Lyngbya confervoides]MCM1981707.1 alpha-glucosidase [Lyngbya confervoides BDU141951]
MVSTSSSWWEESVIYQIYPPTFADANGDGIGDLQGIIQRLDYLNDGHPHASLSLGIDAIWLSPIFASPMGDNGYDVSDYYRINPMYGTLADLDELIAAAHQRRIKLILDLVLNHTSQEHEWFRTSSASQNNEKADWYLWQDPAEDGGVPNNWRSYMGGTGWTFHEARQQYYFHTFKSFQPDLNWRNPAVRAAIADIVRFWLNRGVDGFRLDASSVYSKDQGFRDNPMKFTSVDPEAYDSYHHLYEKDLPENHHIIREIRGILEEYGDRVLIGETFINSKLNESIMFYGVQNDELHLPFEFEFPFSPWHPGYLQQQIEKKEVLTPPGAWPVYFLDNHDIPRHLSRWIACSLCTDPATVAQGAAALLLTLRGTPILYYGQEIGMENHEEIPPDLRQDRAMIKGNDEDERSTRDGARTPMQWDDSPQAGFSFGEAVDPWLPVHPNYKDVNVAKQQSNPDSIFDFYRRLLQVRRQTPALRCGEWRSLIHYPDDLLAYLRRHETDQVLVIINFTQERLFCVDEPLEPSRWRVLVSNCRQAGTEMATLDSLKAFEVSVFQRMEAG